MASFFPRVDFLFLLLFLFFMSSHSLRFGVSRRRAEEKPFIYDPSRVTQLSWSPRAFLYKGFLTENECDHLISRAKGKLERSMVANRQSGKAMLNEARTSSGYFFGKRQDAVIRRIERRIAEWTFLPEENGEGIHVLHYGLGQKYDTHPDYFQDKFNQENGGNRMATVLMYLSNVRKGGETVFPYAEAANTQPKDETYSECARNGFAVKPKKGDALLFFSCHVNATTNPRSVHRSCPVIEGEKWAATRWIRLRSYENQRGNNIQQ
ncbi:probable prolyl 4-hydroxylase 7 isoform X1 [Phalaenopsis equestris]|uniref:probable prolyl 4-hydroxylase 7 isoform X1 n=1 Tax=Phalaenopsis equestris TaxID=78828 RepID=UPI0009E2F2B7|nr:probable prolyl 4-hydroxylase 7 isoform X1 [Phalaenopsis equestris]